MDRGVWRAIVHVVTQLSIHACNQLILVWPYSGRDKIKRGIRTDFCQEPRSYQKCVHRRGPLAASLLSTSLEQEMRLVLPLILELLCPVNGFQPGVAI